MQESRVRSSFGLCCGLCTVLACLVLTGWESGFALGRMCVRVCVRPGRAAACVPTWHHLAADIS